MKQHISGVVGSCFFQLSQSFALLVKKSPSFWSRHSYSADWTTATLYSQAFPSRSSDRCSVYRTPLLLSSLTPKTDHITPVLMHLHWLPIKSRILYKLCPLMHLIYTNQRPAYMAEMVELAATSSSRSGLRSASHLLYRKPALKTMSCERAFSHANTKRSKKLLKTYLFTLSL